MMVKPNPPVPTSMPMRMRADLGKVDQTTRSVAIVASTPNPVDGVAITSWDLSRFEKHPTILWSHLGDELPIGTASDVTWDPEVGLRMNVRFARAEANPKAEQIYQGVIDGIVRAVSVGFEYDDPVIEGGIGSEDPPTARVVRNARLTEVSFVSVGADEDAGTVDINPDAAPETEEMVLAKIVSKAASELAKHRVRKLKASASPRGDAPKDERVDRMDRAPIRLDKAESTPSGGKRIPARLSRVGVLEYRNPDGSARRELRLAEEIFRADSLASLEDAPVIDLEHHTGMVDSETWRHRNLGHVKAVRQDGHFIAGTLVVEDKKALDRIAQGERTEVSLGYRCRLERASGEHQGQRYDCVQRDIVYNHAALCPPNRGRAGPEIGLRLDSDQPWVVAHFDDEEDVMAVKIRLDGREMEEGSREHLDAIERVHKGEIDKVRADAKTALETETAKVIAEKKRADEAEGRLDAAKSEAEQLRTDAAAAKENAAKETAQRSEQFERAVKGKMSLLARVLRFFSTDEDEEEDGEMKDGKKQKRSRLDALVELGDRDIMLKVLRKKQPAFEDEGKSDDYVRARFDALLEQEQTIRGVDGVVRTAEREKENLDGVSGPNIGPNDPVVAARKRRDEWAASAWQSPNGQSSK